jgi:hypothetical protein
MATLTKVAPKQSLQVPADAPPGVAQFLTGIKEYVDQIQGNARAPHDRVPTLRELAEAGLVTLNTKNGYATIDGTLSKDAVASVIKTANSLGLTTGTGTGTGTTGTGTTGVALPTTPSGFTAVGAFTNVILSWDAAAYAGHDYTEIFRSTTSTFTAAVSVQSSKSFVFTDPVGPNVTRYYWIRFVNSNGVAGTVVGPVSATTALIDGATLALGSVDTSALVSALQSRIDLIDAAAAVSGSVNARLLADANAAAAALATEVSDRSTGDAALQTQIDTLAVMAGGDTPTILAAISTEQTARIAADAAEAAARTTMLAQLTGGYTGTDVTLLTTGLIYNESVARASADAAEVSARSALSTTVTTNYSTLNAAITNEASLRTTADSSLATSISSVSATASGKNKVFVQSGTPTATSTADLWIDTGHGNLLKYWNGTAWTDTDDTRIATNVAAIATETSARVSGDAANASSITTIDARVTTAESNIVTNAASISTETTARASADTAIASTITTLTGRTTTAETNITTLFSTTGTQATDITTLYATTAGHTSSILTQAATLTALGGQYTVKIEAGGRVAGFGLANTAADAVGSVFAIVADAFYIAPVGGSSTGAAAFAYYSAPTTINGVAVPAGLYLSNAFISNGAIANAQIGVAAVDTAKIADAAITVAKIADATITAAKIADATITTAKIASAAITSALIADASITTAKIGDASVSTLKIQGNAVTVPSSAYVYTAIAPTSSLPPGHSIGYNDGTYTYALVPNFALTAWYDAASVTVVSSGQRQNIWYRLNAFVSVVPGGGDVDQVVWRVVRNNGILDVELTGSRNRIVADSADTRLQPVVDKWRGTIMVDDTPVAGTYTYKLQVATDTHAASPSDMYFSDAGIMVIETKR